MNITTVCPVCEKPYDDQAEAPKENCPHCGSAIVWRTFNGTQIPAARYDSAEPSEMAEKPEIKIGADFSALKPPSIASAPRHPQFPILHPLLLALIAALLAAQLIFQFITRHSSSATLPRYQYDAFTAPARDDWIIKTAAGKSRSCALVFVNSEWVGDKLQSTESLPEPVFAVEDVLNGIGREGWKLVWTDGAKFIVERPEGNWKQDRFYIKYVNDR